ncbi:MAG: hypothetical protein NTV46_22365 [Verrucomicrobia bacterium]|nr:hypothetical protein [Verrucomicrobiota bacterium]
MTGLIAMLDDALGIGDEEGVGEGIEQAVTFAARGGEFAQVLGVPALLRVAQAADEDMLPQCPS